MKSSRILFLLLLAILIVSVVLVRSGFDGNEKDSFRHDLEAGLEVLSVVDLLLDEVGSPRGEGRSSEGDSMVSRFAGVDSLSQSEQQSLWSVFDEARREVRPLTEHQRIKIENKDAHFLASNPSNHLRIRFLADGVRLLSGYLGRNWAGVVSFAEGEVVEIRQQGTRLEYDYGNMIEWYHNKPEGLEQGWVLRERPNPGGEVVILPLSVDGLSVEPLQGRRPGSDDLQFVDVAGEPVLSYTGLKAWDAEGRELDATMWPTDEGIEILVADAGATYPLVIDPLISSLEQKLGPDVEGAGNVDDYFAYSVSVDGDTALIGAYRDDDNGIGSGAAYVFTRNGSDWRLQDKLHANDGSSEGPAGDHFGYSVSIDDDTALIGASEDDENGTNSGSAYVFVRSGNSWSEQQKLLASDGSGGDLFGASVSVDGNTVLIGASSNQADLHRSGSAYVYIRSGNTWYEQQKLTPSGITALDDGFGVSVSVDGDTALIGVSGDDDYGSSSGSAFVFVRSGNVWSEQQKLSAGIGSSGAQFGRSVSLDRETALIGAHGSGLGSAYVFVRSGDTWSEEQKLVASDGSISDGFGYSVSLDRDTALVGGFKDDEASSDAVYVFTRSEGDWSEQQKLSNGERMGRSVALSSDTALVGSNYLTQSGKSSGSAEVYVRDGNTWGLQGNINAGDSAVDEGFGHSVAVHGDTAVVGVTNDDDNGSLSGAAYVFVRSGSSWSKQQKLTASDGDAGDFFGGSVCVDDDTVLVGASYDDDNGSAAGSAYVFVRSGSIWSQQQKLIEGPLSGVINDNFGGSVSVDGDTALIGVRGNDDLGSNAGAAYVFVRSGSSWSKQQKLTAADAVAGDRFGYSVSLDEDTALIGMFEAEGDDVVTSGAYVFVRGGSVWTQEQKLVPSDLDQPDDAFGTSVSLDGDTALVGAYLEDDKGSNSGAAYVFVRNASVWSQQQKLLASDGSSGDRFGESVSLAGDTVLIGAYQDDDNGVNSGSAYAFVRSGNVWAHSQKFVASDGAAGDYFGGAVSLDGDTALISAYEDDGLDSLGGQVANQGGVYVFRVATVGASSDGDGVSDAFEIANGFDPDVAGDHLTQDSDGDGQIDLWEIFSGTDKNDATSVSALSYTSFNLESSTLITRMRRDLDGAVVLAMPRWSLDLSNWYAGGVDLGAVRVEIDSSVVERGDDYEIIELAARVTRGNVESLFLSVELIPVE